MKGRRSEVRRLPERASYDRDLIYRIFDEALICHVAFTDAEGGPVVIPTIHARVDDTLYFHGSPASRMLRSIRGHQVAVSVTLLDGIVLAKAHMHHSMNYRSAIAFGPARAVDGHTEKSTAFEAIVEHLVAGRWEGARRPNDKEFRGTSVVAVDIEEASAKQRSGPPVDDPEDLDLPYWAGVIPLRMSADQPQATDNRPAPEHVVNWSPNGSSTAE